MLPKYDLLQSPQGISYTSDFSVDVLFWWSDDVTQISMDIENSLEVVFAQ